MFGVVTAPGRERGGRAPWTVEEFYEHGRHEAGIFIEMWTKYLSQSPNGRLIEIGCGAGRLTGPMAQVFDQVIAVDVSEDMLALARASMPANVECRLSDGWSLPVDSESLDAGFSYVVFQHFENMEMIDTYIAELRRVLKPGGTVMLHIPAVEVRERVRQMVTGFRVRRRLTQMIMGRRGVLPRPSNRFWVTMNYRMYPEAKIRSALSRHGFASIVTDRMYGSDKRGTFYFARRAE